MKVYVAGRMTRGGNEPLKEVSRTEVSWTGLAHWENRTTLRFKGELALTAIDNRESAFVKVPVPSVHETHETPSLQIEGCILPMFTISRAPRRHRSWFVSMAGWHSFHELPPGESPAMALPCAL